VQEGWRTPRNLADSPASGPSVLSRCAALACCTASAVSGYVCPLEDVA
jgi:hypothetical protein